MRLVERFGPRRGLRCTFSHGSPPGSPDTTPPRFGSGWRSRRVAGDGHQQRARNTESCRLLFGAIEPRRWCAKSRAMRRPHRFPPSYPGRRRNVCRSGRQGDVRGREVPRRTLDVPPFLAAMLAEHLARRGRPDPDELVFVAPEGGPLRRSTFRTRVFNPAVLRAGLDGLTFHALRHSAVGLMVEAGAHPEAIKARLGHASIRTTVGPVRTRPTGRRCRRQRRARGTIWCTDGARATPPTLTGRRMAIDVRFRWWS
jgi:Phage integrase family